MVMVQVYFGLNCIKHFKGFNCMYSWPENVGTNDCCVNIYKAKILSVCLSRR